MKLLKLSTLTVCLLAVCMVQAQRRTINFDQNWKFFLGDVENGQEKAFDDKGWRTLDVPHDWSIEGDFNKDNPTGRGGAYMPSGIGWYRKGVSFPAADAKKSVSIEFEGVMANSDVWVNGHHLGKRPFGYISFWYDLTPYLTFDGKPNIIAVRADNSVQPASRWYTGAGIYRHVRLSVTDPTHIDQWGVFITTPEVSAEKALVSVKVSVANDAKTAQKLTVSTVVTSPSGKKISSDKGTISLAAGTKGQAEVKINVPNPELWDINSPNLYKAVTTVSAGNKALDNVETTFGIREFHFEAATGFWLNGKNIKILGASVHQDGGAVGAAVPAAVWQRRIERLKEVGCNALRTAHNPADPTLLDLCDKMGMLVMDETFDTWTSPKNHASKGYNLYFNEWWSADTRDLVLRDRNHPSVIIYSVGNEIRDRLDTDAGRQRFTDQRDLIKSLDPTRPITLALFRPNEMKVYDNGFVELMDLVGQNYRENELVAAWKAKPERMVIGTENRPDRATWLYLRDNPFMAGQFIWTGFDYLGESDWPQVIWDTGIFGHNADWKAHSWERQSWWSKKPMVHILRKDDNGGAGQLTSDWTPIDFDTYDQGHVTVYSNCEEVELYLNGESLGKKTTPANDEALLWIVNFTPGTIKAVGRNGGKDVAVQEHVTASAPVKVALTSEKQSLTANWDDVVYVTAAITDKDGVRFPNSHHKVKFTVSDNAEIVAVASGDVRSHERFKSDERSVFKGEATAIIRAKRGATGNITVKASAEGLDGSSVTIGIAK